MRLNKYHIDQIKKIKIHLAKQPIFSAEEIRQKLGTVRVGKEKKPKIKAENN